MIIMNILYNMYTIHGYENPLTVVISIEYDYMTPYVKPGSNYKHIPWDNEQ